MSGQTEGGGEEEEERVGGGGGGGWAKPGEAFLLAPRAGSSSADSLEVYTGRGLLGRSGVGGLGHSSTFLKLPSRPLANSKVGAGIITFPLYKVNILTVTPLIS